MAPTKTTVSRAEYEQAREATIVEIQELLIKLKHACGYAQGESDTHFRNGLMLALAQSLDQDGRTIMDEEGQVLRDLATGLQCRPMAFKYDESGD